MQSVAHHGSVLNIAALFSSAISIWLVDHSGFHCMERGNPGANLLCTVVKKRWEPAPFSDGLLLKKSNTVASLAHKCGTRISIGAGQCRDLISRASAQDRPTRVLSYVCWEVSWKQSNSGFMSNQPTVMFKAQCTLPSVPQQAASALSLPLGSPVVQGCSSSSTAAGLQGTTYQKRCCFKQDGC